VTSPAGPAGPPQLLDAALRLDPARPLITFYDDATDERTELSVTTFANWVAKTANLLRDDLGAGPGATVALDLPVHWQAAVWLQAGWALGLHVVPAGSVADLAVVAYGGAAPAGSGEVVAVGLGPMGLPRRDAGPPAGTTLDYDREVHGHGDRFVPAGAPDPAAPALTVAGDALSGADLVAAARGVAPLPPGARLLVARPLDSVRAVLAGLLVPLATDVTAVLCRPLDPARLPGRARQEGLVAAVGADTPGVPAWSVGGSV
jgi:uncharacterized protein (TIGR03089 family)